MQIVNLFLFNMDRFFNRMIHLVIPHVTTHLHPVRGFATTLPSSLILPESGVNMNSNVLSPQTASSSPSSSSSSPPHSTVGTQVLVQYTKDEEKCGADTNNNNNNLTNKNCDDNNQNNQNNAPCDVMSEMLLTSLMNNAASVKLPQRPILKKQPSQRLQQQSQPQLQNQDQDALVIDIVNTKRVQITADSPKAQRTSSSASTHNNVSPSNDKAHNPLKYQLIGYMRSN